MFAFVALSSFLGFMWSAFVPKTADKETQRPTTEVAISASLETSPPSQIGEIASPVSTEQQPISNPEPMIVKSSPTVSRSEAVPYKLYKQPAPPPKVVALPTPPETGTTLGGQANGPSRLKLVIENGTDSDAVVTLTRAFDIDEVISFYVRKQDNYALAGVEPGTYDVWVRKGLGWQSAKEEFVDPESYGKFDKSLTFSQYDTNDGVTRSEGHSLTLHAVLSGNIQTTVIDKAGMPKVGSRHS